MQLAIAPTRAEVDTAHSKREWLDIGIPSARNLRYVEKKRTACWLLLAISSVPLQLVYNSAVFATSVATEYLVAEMDPSYLATGLGTTLKNVTFDNSGLDFTLRSSTNMTQISSTFDSILANSSTWTNLSSVDCAREYSQPMLTKYRTLVLVAEPSDEHAQLPGLWRIAGTPIWMCDESSPLNGADPVSANGEPEFRCDSAKAEFGTRNHTNWKVPGKTQYCLAEPFKQDCVLELSQGLMIATIVANAIKAIVMLVLFFGLQTDTLTNLGDAILSFL